jgi:Cof subfamily protein (haloacid dehalogenase superfamily)
MDKYKMICLDIDGTLLNSEHRISQRTKEVIQLVSEEMKIPIILVSARMPRGILFLLEELKISNPIICYSGALIMDSKINKLLSVTIPISEARHVVKLARNLGIHVSLYKDDEWYVEQLDEWAEQEGEITNITPGITNFENLLDLWGREDSGPNKILCMAEPKEIKALNSRILAYNCKDLNIYLSKPTYLEIMPGNASKTSAIEVLCVLCDIKRSEVLAIGDNYNDINMIEYAGLGIAMGNAPDEVKQYADYITLSNDEDGVAEALKKYML